MEAINKRFLISGKPSLLRIVNISGSFKNNVGMWVECLNILELHKTLLYFKNVLSTE